MRQQHSSGTDVATNPYVIQEGMLGFAASVEAIELLYNNWPTTEEVSALLMKLTPLYVLNSHTYYTSSTILQLIFLTLPSGPVNKPDISISSLQSVQVEGLPFFFQSRA